MYKRKGEQAWDLQLALPRQSPLIGVKAGQVVWQREAPDHRLLKAPHPLKAIMVHRISWFRGEGKGRIRPKISYLFGLINPPRTREDLRFNRKLVKRLLPNAFHCRELQPGVDPYEHPSLQECIGAMFFWCPDALGMVYHKHLRPIPLPTTAMTLTTMQHCLQEWGTGRFGPLDLNAGKQLKMYESHLKGLLAYAKKAPKRLHEFQEKWFWYGVDCAGVSLEEDEPYQATTRADQIRPDTPDS
ncbi:hypothetical protein BDV93DRAFT_564522 [Ceratobasidium sp. AG-I]|nr:hypothetical protein BDV93DRAFT_564522 [Ceratobasidium sp. AG-I]